MPFAGDKILYQAMCGSTNTVAMELLATSTPLEETVVITDQQYQGKGQRGATWLSEPYKNLTFSLILYPTFLPLQQSFMLNVMTTLAIHQVIAIYAPSGLTIKWPNDIYYQNKKLSGILIENTVNQGQLKASVIGIGLNVNQENFALSTATSLSLICKQQFDLTTLLNQLLEAIKAKYIQLKKQDFMALKEVYLKKLYGIHQTHSFQAHSEHFQGIIRDVDILGRLVVEKESGHQQYYACKEISLIV
jgi:BirA family transcriptional regulator, biotin operon repressor / biotin---[acetyl-CoA-carboxylase] ligase